MSVFSLDVAAGNPVTQQDLDKVCSILGVSIKHNEKDDYLNLLAVYHDSMAKLMAMGGESNHFPPKLSHLTYDRQTTSHKLTMTALSERMSTSHHHPTMNTVHGLGVARSLMATPTHPHSWPARQPP